MKYLVSVMADTAGLATPAEIEASDAFNDRIEAEGHWVLADGLGSPRSATVIDNRGSEPVVTDGPVQQSKEDVAGFWVLEAPDLDAAHRLAAEGSRASNRKVEVRPLL
jgi:hypothetical protein